MTGLPVRPSSGTLRQLAIGEKWLGCGYVYVDMSTRLQRYRLIYTKDISSHS